MHKHGWLWRRRRPEWYLDMMSGKYDRGEGELWGASSNWILQLLHRKQFTAFTVGSQLMFGQEVGKLKIAKRTKEAECVH